MDFDGRYYRLLISVAEGESGHVVYNVAKIRERTVPTLRGSSSKKTGAQGRNNSFFKKKIPQSETDVNTQHSESEGSVTDRQLLHNLHGAFADKGWRYRKAFFQDFDGRYYQLTVSVASGTGGNVVYNISEMRERNFPTPKGSSNNNVGARGEKVSFSEKNIPQSETDVNIQHSESEGSVTDRQLLREEFE